MTNFITYEDISRLARPCTTEPELAEAMIAEAQRVELKPRLGDALYVAVGETDSKGRFRTLLDGGQWKDRCGATRLLTGLSYSFGKWAVLSADYERVWYNGMRLKNANEGAMASYKQQVRSHYKAANNYRIGLEIKPVSFLALRAGFGQQGNMLRDGVTTSGEKISGELSMFNSYDNPVVYKVSSGSAGIGLRFNAMYIDLAYTFNRLHYSQYMMYYFYNSKDTDPNNRPLSQVGHTADGEEILMSYKQSIDRHGVMLTFGVRF